MIRSSMARDLVLLTEDTFHAAYLLMGWQREFGPGCTILIRSAEPGDALLRARQKFRAEFRGRRTLGGPAWRRLEELYPGLSETDRAMVAAFGVPGPISRRGVRFIGPDVNGQEARDWLTARCAGSQGAGGPWAGGWGTFICVFLDRILHPWWIELTGSRIANAHSAVLPFARGMHAIEQVAATGDPELFGRCAGATVHYVDAGIDTGPVILAERFTDPFCFASVWDCKARSFGLAFDLLLRLSREVAARPGVLPAGVAPSPATVGPEFKRADFTSERRLKAEAAYQEMRRAARAGNVPTPDMAGAGGLQRRRRGWACIPSSAGGGQGGASLDRPDQAADLLP